MRKHIIANANQFGYLSQMPINGTARRGGSWRVKERKLLLMKEPLCRPCLAQGKVSLATQRDHVIPLHKGGPDTRENTQPICVACHEQKTRIDCGHKVKQEIGLDGWPI